MKYVVFAIMFMMVCFTVFAKDNIFVEGKDKLPIKAQNFIDSNLVNERIVYVKESRVFFFKKEYLAVFANGLKIEFNSAGDWVDMLSSRNGLPQKIIPEKIWQYVNVYYMSTHIMEIEKKRKSVMRVMLSNKQELYFDRFGRRMKDGV